MMIGCGETCKFPKIDGPTHPYLSISHHRSFISRHTRASHKIGYTSFNDWWVCVLCVYFSIVVTMMIIRICCVLSMGVLGVWLNTHHKVERFSLSSDCVLFAGWWVWCTNIDCVYCDMHQKQQQLWTNKQSISLMVLGEMFLSLSVNGVLRVGSGWGFLAANKQCVVTIDSSWASLLAHVTYGPTATCRLKGPTEDRALPKHSAPLFALPSIGPSRTARYKWKLNTRTCRITKNTGQVLKCFSQ